MNTPKINTDQIIGTAFEYAEISMTSARIVNDIDKLLSILDVYSVSIADIKQLSDIRQLLHNYHFKYTATSLLKHLNETT